MKYQINSNSILIFLIITYVRSEDVIVSTSKGQLLGETISTPFGRKLDIWRSIPYAKPPTGELRFKHPIPNDGWSGIINAKKFPNLCYQKVNFNFINYLRNRGQQISEDCLYLSVYAPNPRPNTGAVLVWIHNGGYSGGSISNSNQNFKMLSAFGDIIIVAMQYRLSSFGFLYGGNSEIPGNAGFHDQILALQWVQDNIAEFGGDPSKVTLAGQGSGASNVGLHLISPISSQLVSQGILQSGSPNNIAAVTTIEDSLETFNTISESLGCFTRGTTDSDVANCLRSASAFQLMNYSPSNGLNPIPDNETIVGDSSSMLNVDTDTSKNILIGSNKDEGSLSLASLSTEYLGNKRFNNILPLSSSDFKSGVDVLLRTLPADTSRSIYCNYMVWEDPENSTALTNSLIKLYSDYLTDCDLDQFIDWAVEKDWKVYRYYFNYRSVLNTSPNWTGIYSNIEENYEFGLPLILRKRLDDINISRKLMGFIAEFVKTGSPTEDSCMSTWLPYIADRKGYYELSRNSSYRTDWPENNDCVLLKNLDYLDYEGFDICDIGEDDVIDSSMLFP